MKISVIVPFHKGVHFLTDCLDSLCDQTEKDFEVLIVADRVEENLDSLLASYKSKLQITKLISQEEGVAAARNLGKEYATGEYIYFLDSDDYLEETTLEELLKTAKSSKKDFVYGPLEYTWFNRHIYHETKDVDVQQQIYTGNAEKDLLTGRLGLRRLSVVNILIKRSALAGIAFEKLLRLYSDIPVLADILKKADNISFCEKGIYIKRFHNEEILYPSLSYGDFKDRYEKLILAYQNMKENHHLSKKLKNEFDEKLLGFCHGIFLRRFRQEKVSDWKNSKFSMFHQYMKEIAKDAASDKMQKKVLEGFCQNDYKQAKKKINKILAKKKIKKMLTNRRFFYRTINKYVFERFSQKDNWVVFESFLGRNYSDSPKYIYKYLLEHKGDKYRYIWIINDTKTKIPGNPVKVKRFSLKYFYYMTRAKYWVNNMRQPVWYAKRDSQVLLETWHGTPLKKLVFDMDDVYSASPTYKRQVYSQSRFWDYLVSANPFSTDVFQSCFLYEKDKILESGYPRNDILYAPNKEEIAAQIKKNLGIPEDKKTILYAPTWRDDEFYDKGQYKFKLKLDLEYLRKEIGDEYVILLRTHYFIADAIDVTGMEDFVFNVSKYNDIAELYLISDICITDYSSVFFDYANLRRPILFFTYDLEKYRDVLRGFYISIEDDVPGPLLFTNEEIADAVKNIDKVNEQYAQRYEEFYNRFCCFDDGHASQRVVERVFDN